MSRYAGSRFDLAQANGGNSSVKTEGDLMYVKASGCSLADVDRSRGYAQVSYKKIAEILNDEKLINNAEPKKRDELLLRVVNEAVFSGQERPSIEVFLHSILDTYALHVHPVVVNTVTCQKSWSGTLRDIFNDAALVAYKTPGVELAMELKKAVEEFTQKTAAKPKIIFLQNHGLIVTSDKFDDIEPTVESVLGKIEKYLGVDFSRYKLTTKLAELLKDVTHIYPVCYLSEDAQLKSALKSRRDMFFAKPSCPETLIFCGACCVEIKDFKDRQVILDYNKKYGQLPKVVVFQDDIFFVASTMKKAKEAEDVFKAHILSLTMAKGGFNCLSDQEIKYLSDLESEKYRQQI